MMHIKKLAELERTGKLRAVVTQNIDGLHQAAGSKVVYELHGSVHRNYCMQCHRFYDAEYMYHAEGIPRCETCGGILKPDVVLYLDKPGNPWSCSDCRRYFAGGISGGWAANIFKGKALVVINKGATPMDQKSRSADSGTNR